MTKRTNRAASLRATTPPTVNTISVSEFVRGGLYQLGSPTVVVSHGTELGTWVPRGSDSTSVYYAASSTLDPNVSATPVADQTITFALGTHLRRNPQARDALAEAVEKLHKYLREGPDNDEEEDK